ncbi:MAG: aspartate carbamoyltransferase [Polyangiaceae bacterium]|nr:aspartate carbamoyltransferase [Polyangiaceae bacterium]
MNHLVTIGDLSRDRIEGLLDLAAELDQPEKKHALSHLLRGYVVATMFFEASTRTRLSFESAALRLGAGVVGFAEADTTSTKKGETLEDTVRMCMAYGDVLVLRHPEIGSAARAAKVASVPVVNGGDGANEHPTQTLVDLYTIRKAFGKVDGLRIAFVGDLLYGRTVHSLLAALAKYTNITATLVGPKSLALPESHRRHATLHGIDLRDADRLEDAIPEVDLVYMTRIQKERFPPGAADVGGSYRLDAKMLGAAKKELRVLHPLPRVDEIATDVDATPHALYFPQAANGVPVRQAVLLSVLGVKP